MCISFVYYVDNYAAASAGTLSVAQLPEGKKACGQCGISVLARNISRHSRLCKGPKPEKISGETKVDCTICKEKGLLGKNLERHFQSQTHKNNLAMHTRSVYGLKQVREDLSYCSDCGLVLRTNNLKRHYATHAHKDSLDKEDIPVADTSVVEKVACEGCHKEVFKQNLNRHHKSCPGQSEEKIHWDSKVNCAVCDMSDIVGRNFKRHLESQTHKKNILLYTGAIYEEKEPYSVWMHCVSCGIDIRKTNFSRHCTSDRHQEAEKREEQMGLVAAAAAHPFNFVAGVSLDQQESEGGTDDFVEPEVVEVPEQSYEAN